jgi:hypothetical protein
VSVSSKKDGDCSGTVDDFKDEVVNVLLPNNEMMQTTIKAATSFTRFLEARIVGAVGIDSYRLRKAKRGTEEREGDLKELKEDVCAKVFTGQLCWG